MLPQPVGTTDGLADSAKSVTCVREVAMWMTWATSQVAKWTEPGGQLYYQKKVRWAPIHVAHKCPADHQGAGGCLQA